MIILKNLCRTKIDTMKEINRMLRELEEGFDRDLELVWYTDSSGMIRHWNGSKTIHIFHSEEQLLEFLIKKTS